MSLRLPTRSQFDFALPRVAFPSPFVMTEFMVACQSSALRFNPKQLGFIPSNLWVDRETDFSQTVSDFFRRKNNQNCRFIHKLYNGLRLVEADSMFLPFVGVSWLNASILKVDKVVFARLLGIRSIDGSLFHQQGNFPSHGFVEIGAGDVREMCPPDVDLSGIDFGNVRLVFHLEGVFTKGCTEAEIENCRWANTKTFKT